jgi:hypothetical protein
MAGFRVWRALSVSGLALLALARAGAVEVTDLKGLEDIYGRYAPAGDCKREPRILVDASGLTFERGGQSEKATKVEYAASYGAHDYTGIQKVIFPFSSTNGWPVIMLFNYEEKPGALVIQGHDEGYQGGPPLSARNQVLVAASPYARCR